MSGDVRQMVLDLLVWIRTNVDRTLSFRSSCCEGVCGSCSMLINTLNTLACIQPIWLINYYVVVYPLPHFNVIRDIVIDLKHFYEQYTYVNPFYSVEDISGFMHIKHSCMVSALLCNFNYIFGGAYLFSINYITSLDLILLNSFTYNILVLCLYNTYIILVGTVTEMFYVCPYFYLKC